MKTANRSIGSSMVLALMFIALMTLTAGSYLTVISSGSTGTARIAESQKAFYAAEAGAHRLMDQLNSSGTSSVTGSLAPGSYTGNYTATFDNVDTITSTGTVGNISRVVTLKVDFHPAAARAALTIDGYGRMWGRRLTLDGRTHSPNGKVLSQEGTFGLSANRVPKQRFWGGAKIGGNGYAPSYRNNPATYEVHKKHLEKNQPWEILGVSQSWFNMNVPLRTGMPPRGFEGIWYTNGQEKYVGSIDDVKGIVIVHNEKGKAILNAVHGNFEGLLIADNIRYFHGAKIYGAVIATRQKYPLYGWWKPSLIAYSPEALRYARKFLGGRTSNWQSSVQAGTWSETAGSSTSTGLGSRKPPVPPAHKKEQKPGSGLKNYWKRFWKNIF